MPIYRLVQAARRALRPAVLIAAATLCACAEPPPPWWLGAPAERKTPAAKAAEAPYSQTEIPDLRAAIAAIDPQGPITYDDALAMARYYLIRFSSTPGTLGALIDDGEHWRATVFFRTTNLPIPPIVIDKKTGRISWSYGPTIRGPRELLAR